LHVLEDTRGFPGGIEAIDWPEYSVAKVARKRRNAAEKKADLNGTRTSSTVRMQKDAAN
jgi:hypothetical protein